MVTKYIFDLDGTLYKDIGYFKYSNIKANPMLRYYLKILKNCYIFTNGTKFHLENCLKRLKCTSCFKNTISREEFFPYLKPSIHPYRFSIIKFNLLNDKVIFFEDQLINLKTAKLFGWTTVYIGRLKNLPNYVNFQFSTINQALKFFINNFR